MNSDLPTPHWRKSSRSTGTGACVEVASTSTGMAVRDSKKPTAGTISLPTTAWTAFLAHTTSGPDLH